MRIRILFSHINGRYDGFVQQAINLWKDNLLIELLEKPSKLLKTKFSFYKFKKKTKKKTRHCDETLGLPGCVS